MKIQVLKPTEVEITEVHVRLPVRYGEEDIPNDFPLRVGDLWAAAIDIDTGKIHHWPEGESGELQMKVTDCGTYELRGPSGRVAIIEENYVPNGVVPGEYGDYVHLKIGPDGVISNWPKKPGVSEFFGEGDQ